MRTTAQFYDITSGKRIAIKQCQILPRPDDVIVFEKIVYKVQQIWFVTKGSVLTPRVALQAVPYLFADNVPGGMPKPRKGRLKG